MTSIRIKRANQIGSERGSFPIDSGFSWTEDFKKAYGGENW
ncbi:Uncharacterised protein [Actinomyces bovis]|uniref:Uncharacterized protein n=1 Tax=Actinomyces bovis TaxID=1658 RepID=A0ABY1VM31_9ACTO|nr:Uncharacterised protein [Actinomyces bovis]VEG52346.1 Uncharacterised protein [Actinomyces israelii]